jgi:LSD1 subclass zinc finger protein
MVVKCANCGKQFKGSPGPRKYKCSSCGNLFTFPPGARKAAAGNILCSSCWSEMKLAPGMSSCPLCGQKMSAEYGGEAQDEAGAAPPSADKPAQAAGQPPSSPQLSVPAPQPPATHERDQALARVREAEAKAAAAEAKLNSYREAALAALEPLLPEFTEAMQARRSEAARLAEVAAVARHHLQDGSSTDDMNTGLGELEALDSGLAELQKKLQAVQDDLSQRFRAVLGEPASAQQSDQPKG